MYLIYVDESGDLGEYQGENSQHFILSGLIIHEETWKDALARMKVFRQKIKSDFGLLLKTELHATELIRIKKIKEYRKIKKMDRIKILGLFMQNIPVIYSTSKVINVCLNKSDFPMETDYQILAWKRMIQRYDNYLKKQDNSRGVIISDETDEPKVRGLIRKMRVYNPFPSNFKDIQNSPTDNILEDVFTRTSEHSYFIQTVDSIAHCLYRKEYPKSSLQKHGVNRYFEYMKSLLLLEESEPSQNGVVRK
ncbi:DUF3800 domain-containing protein [candidate division KSB1 bacterium]|nr:DUF3800 domain-containing protein [candidate division KSB1 bacterium]